MIYTNTFRQYKDAQPTARKAVVQVYFPTHNTTLAYYNDCFDLQEGDMPSSKGVKTMR